MMELPRKNEIIDFWGVCERIKEMKREKPERMKELDGTYVKNNDCPGYWLTVLTDCFKELRSDYLHDSDYNNVLRSADRVNSALDMLKKTIKKDKIFEKYEKRR